MKQLGPRRLARARLRLGWRFLGGCLQRSDVGFDLFAILVVQAQEFDAQTVAFANITNARYRDHSMPVGELESDDHSSAGANRFFGGYVHSAGADVRHISP